MRHIAGKTRSGVVAGTLLAGLVALAGATAAVPASAQQTGQLPLSPSTSTSACPAEEAVVDQSAIVDPTTIPKVSQDPFYRPPSGFAACPKGYVLRSRKVNVEYALSIVSTTYLTSLVRVLEQIPIAGPFVANLPIIRDVAKNLQLNAYQLLFRSTDAHGQPVVAATTVVVPEGGIWKVYADRMHLSLNLDRDWNAPTTSRPVVSYQTNQDCGDLDSAPSYALRVGWATRLLDGRFWQTPPPEAAIQGIPELLSRLGIPGFLWLPPELILNTKGKIPKIAIDDFEISLGIFPLLEGYAVAFPDHQGPYGDFINGRQSGQITLDGIRAATNYRHYAAVDRVDATSKVALWSYSGGSAASAWAVETVSAYAPDLAKNNLVGAALGASPVGDLGKMLDFNKNRIGIGFVFMAVKGLIRAYPEYPVADVLSEYGGRVVAEAGKYATLDGIIELLAKWLDDTSGNMGIEYYTIDPSRPVNSWPAVAAVERVNSIGVQPSQLGTPRIPTLIYHDQQDGLVPVDPDDTVIRKYCKEGSAVQVMRLDTSLLTNFDPSVLGVATDKVGRTWQVILRDLPGFAVHILGEVTGALPALNYLSRRFNGAEPRNDCGQIPYPTVDNNPPGKWKAGFLPQWIGANAPWEPQPSLLHPGTTHRSGYRVFSTD